MKKILCLVLTLTMLLSCCSMSLNVFAKGEFDNLYRPDGTNGREDIVGKVIDPILKAKDTVFANNINELGYDSVNAYADKKMNITKETFDVFITNFADDKMFGVDYDFLYSKNSGAYFWSACGYDLETNPDIHKEEVAKAESTGRSSTCAMKGMYDACAEVLNGYDYDYTTKSVDKDIFNNIVEKTVLVHNKATGKDEIHYNYYYDFTKGDFSLVRANGNNQIINTICKVWNSDALFATKDAANENAKAIAKFIGNLFYADFNEEKVEKAVPFTDNKKIKAYDFFTKVTELSGLDKILQDYWCNATTFDVKTIMYAFGVNVEDDVLLNVETEKGLYMGARILTDMFRGFYKNPVLYVETLIQMFSKSYNYSYKRAIEALFTLKHSSMYSKSTDKATYPELNRYNGNELSTVDGLVNFIADCVYVATIDIYAAEVEMNEKAIADKESEIADKNRQIAAKESELALAKNEKPSIENQLKIQTIENDLTRFKSELATLKQQLTALKELLADNKVKLAEHKTNKFSFAPMPINRFATAKDADELHLYFLCYFELNRIYENNASQIEAFITNIISALRAEYQRLEEEAAQAAAEKESSDESGKKGIFDSWFNKDNDEEEEEAAPVVDGDEKDPIAETEMVLRSLFAGDFTMIDVLTFHLDVLTQNTIDNFSPNFTSSVKNAIAGLIQKFVDAMESLMNLLFGWLS